MYSFSADLWFPSGNFLAANAVMGLILHWQPLMSQGGPYGPPLVQLAMVLVGMSIKLYKTWLKQGFKMNSTQIGFRFGRNISVGVIGAVGLVMLLVTRYAHAGLILHWQPLLSHGWPLWTPTGSVSHGLF